VATSTSVSGTDVGARCKIKRIGEMDRKEAQGPKEVGVRWRVLKKIGEKGRVLKKSERGATLCKNGKGKATRACRTSADPRFFPKVI